MLSCRGGAGRPIRAKCASLRPSWRGTSRNAPHNPALHISRDSWPVRERTRSGGACAWRRRNRRPAGCVPRSRQPAAACRRPTCRVRGQQRQPARRGLIRRTITAEPPRAGESVCTPRRGVQHEPGAAAPVPILGRADASRIRNRRPRVSAVWRSDAGPRSDSSTQGYARDPRVSEAPVARPTCCPGATRGGRGAHEGPGRG